jgi:putative membrane protein
VLLGIEEIGTEIENPFGDDANDLPLEEICMTIINNIEDLITVNSQETLEVRSSELELSPDASQPFIDRPPSV